MRNPYPLVAILAGVLGLAPLAGQDFREFPLGAGFPLTPVGRVFATRNAIAITDGTSIHTVTGLPDQASFSTQVVTPAGSQAMAGPWGRLADDVAVFHAISGELILVRNLPANPTLVSTGIFTPGLSLRPVNRTTAAHLDKAGNQLFVLRHGVGGATLHQVSSPVPLAPWPTFDWGAQNDDCCLAMGGAMNRELVSFNGLSGPPSGFTATATMATPFGWSGNALHGFFLTESGSGVGWEHLSLTDVELTFVRQYSGTNSFSRYVFGTSGTFEPGAPIPPRPAMGANVILSWVEEYTVTNKLVIDIDNSPHVGSTWCSQDICGETVAVAEDELLHLAFAGGGHVHEVAAGPHAGSTVLPNFVATGLEPIDFMKPNPETLAVLSHVPLAYAITLYGQLNGSLVPRFFQFTAGVARPKMIEMGDGLVGVLSEDDLGSQSMLRVFSAPLVAAVGTSQPGYAPFLFATSWPPTIGSPFSLDIWAPSGTGAPQLGLSLALDPGQVLPPPFSPHTPLDLDLGRFVGLLPSVPSAAGPGLWTVNLGTLSAPPDLWGLPLYFQAIVPPSPITLSNTLTVIAG